MTAEERQEAQADQWRDAVSEGYCPSCATPHPVSRESKRVELEPYGNRLICPECDEDFLKPARE